MQTTVCAYCDHEVKITPDGTCLYCGGNLAEKALEGIDESRKTRMERISDMLGIYPEPISRKSRKEFIAPYLSGTFDTDRLENIRDRLQKDEPIQTSIEKAQKNEMKQLDAYTKIAFESETVKQLVKSLRPNWFVRNWPMFFVIGIIFGGAILLAYSITVVSPIHIPMDISPILSLLMGVIPICFILIMIKKLGHEL